MSASSGLPPLARALRPLRVLLAEDNVTNQKLAVCLLQKHGHSVVVAEDGEKAVEAVSRETFDLILMDVQMPIMDGLEATAAIREQQRANGVRTPIVALTANALIGDRERCLRAGMDNYVAKPLNAASLFAIIEQTVNAVPTPASPNSGVPVATSPSTKSPAFDYAASLAQIGDEPELLAQLIEVFLEQLPSLLPPITEAVRQRDGKAIRQSAHALCSSASVLAAVPAKEAARRLELMGLNLDLDHVEAAHNQVMEEVSHLRDTLNHWFAKKAA